MILNLSILPISEGYGRVLDMTYANPGDKADPNRANPYVLQLGKWRHPRTKNTLVGGINLKYLNDHDILVLRRYLPDILVNKNLKSRYWAGREDVPNRLRKLNKNDSAEKLSYIFQTCYRTYNRDLITSISPKTFRYMSADELKALSGREDTSEVQELKKLADEIKAMKAAGKTRGLKTKIDRYNEMQAGIEEKELMGKVDEIKTMRRELKRIKATGGDTKDLEAKIRTAMGELPVKSRRKLEKILKPSEVAAPVTPQLEPELPPEAEPETTQDRAKDAVDNKVARKVIAQIDDRIKKDLQPTEPEKTNVEPDEGEGPEVGQTPSEEPEEVPEEVPEEEPEEPPVPKPKAPPKKGKGSVTSTELPDEF